jgi:hypothetical protein
MPSGGPLHLFFNPNVIPCGPPLPPPPEVGPLTPSSIIGGMALALGGTGTIDLSVLGAEAGDLILVAMFCFNTPSSSGYTMVGHMPLGWTLFREDFNDSTTVHPNLYSGIASKIATGTEGADTWTCNFGQAFGFVVLRHCDGIDAASITKLANDAISNATLAGVLCHFPTETVLLAVGTTAAGGPNYSSDDGFPLVDSSHGFAGHAWIFGTTQSTPGTTPPRGVTDIAPGSSIETFTGYQISMKPGGA